MITDNSVKTKFELVKVTFTTCFEETVSLEHLANDSNQL